MPLNRRQREAVATFMSFAEGVRNPRPSVDEAKVASLFSHYAEEGEEGEDPFVGSSGIVRLCEDIGVDAGTDLVALVIAQQMNAAAFLRFEAAEWRQGFFNLGVDTLDGLRAMVPKLRAMLDDDEYFKAFFAYVFKFVTSSKKNMAKEHAVAYLQMLLPEEKWALSPAYCEFLTDGAGVTHIPEDTWKQTLEFARLIAPDLSNWDEDGAWPVLLDEFVDWLRSTGRAGT